MGREKQVTLGTSPTRIFSPWARRFIAVIAIVCGLVLALSAADQGSNRLYVGAFVLFAIAAANLLPARIAKWFAKIVALAIVVFCSYYLATSWSGSPQDKYWAIKICVLLGGPALLYLVAGLLPYEFGRGRDESKVP